MSQRSHLLEKFQVQLAAAAAVVLVYFVVWPLVRPWDSFGPATFLPAETQAHAGANFAGLAWLAVITIGIAAASALLTLQSRQEGAILVTLLGVGGISLRSPSIKALLWAREMDLRGAYGMLLAETLVLAALLVVAVLVIAGIRGAVGRVRPNWMWQEILPPDHAASPAKKGSASQRSTRAAERLQALGNFGLGLAASIVLLLILLQSDARGQVVFAVFTSFLLGTMIAQAVLPARPTLAVWAAPFAAAIIFYVLVMSAAVSASPTGWMFVPRYGQVLPVDWLSAGAGGAVAGYWFSIRMKEAKHMEQASQAPQGESA